MDTPGGGGGGVGAPGLELEISWFQPRFFTTCFQSKNKNTILDIEYLQHYRLSMLLMAQAYKIIYIYEELLVHTAWMTLSKLKIYNTIHAYREILVPPSLSCLQQIICTFS